MFITVYLLVDVLLFWVFVWILGVSCFAFCLVAIFRMDVSFVCFVLVCWGLDLFVMFCFRFSFWFWESLCVWFVYCDLIDLDYLVDCLLVYLCFFVELGLSGFWTFVWFSCILLNFCCLFITWLLLWRVCLILCCFVRVLLLGWCWLFCLCVWVLVLVLLRFDYDCLLCLFCCYGWLKWVTCASICCVTCLF